MKGRIRKAIEFLLLRFGMLRPLFNYLIARQSDQVRTILEKPASFRQNLNSLGRLLVKVFSFDEPIFRTVTYLDAKGTNELFQIRLDLSDYTQARYYYQYPDPPLRDLILAGGGTFVDIGANVGIFSVLAANTFKKVYAFEPSPTIFSQLQFNVRNHKHIVPSPLALSAAGGTSTLNVNAMGSGGTSLEPIPVQHKTMTKRSEWPTMTVQTATLDSVLRDVAEIDLVKIDVEGHEVEVLKGASQVLKNHRPILHVETHDEARFQDILKLLPKDYKVFDPQKRVFSEKRPHPDSVFVCPQKMDLLKKVYSC